MLRLKDLREDNDLKQSKISKKLNITQAAYSYYETGKRNIPNETLIKFAKFYDTSTDYILGLTNEKKPDKKAEKE